MKTKKLSAVALDKLAVGDYPDFIFPGLTFRVGAKRRTWTLRHWVGDKQKRETLGYYFGENQPNSMGLAAARDAARSVSERAEMGAPLEPAPQHPRKGGLSVEDVIDRYERMRRDMAAKAERGTKASRVKTLDAGLAVVRKGLDEYLKLPAKQLSKSDVRTARDKIAKRGKIAANRFLGHLGPIWRWASAEDHIETNFIPDILKVGSESKRKRTLSHAEMKKIWDAAGKLDKGPSSRAYGKLVRFLMVMPQRRDEAASLKHGHILGNRWKQDDNKSDRPVTITLTPLALEQIGTGRADEFCFSGFEGKTKISGWSKLKPELDRVSGVSGWVLHDLRRSISSEMQEIGIDAMVISALLNHSVQGVSAHYLHASLEKPKSAALAKWAKHLEEVVGIKRAA